MRQEGGRGRGLASVSFTLPDERNEKRKKTQRFSRVLKFLSTQRDFFFPIDVRFSDLSRVKSRSAVLTEAAAPMEHGTRCRR